MAKTRILFVTQEMKPYTTLTEISNIVRKLPQLANDKGMEIRILMPKFGTINERRHRLHEVVRLSGMNIIVDDEDFPLIIKVASLPGARMQVYFLDNEEFFKRKFIFGKDNGKPFDDNADRMVFFCKGVIETVKKFGWAPDLIHCHGWMTSLIPLYLRKAYSNEPLFKDSKIIYSVYGDDMKHGIKPEFAIKARINELKKEDLTPYFDGDHVTLEEGGISHADAIVKGSDDLPENLIASIDKLDVVKMDKPSEDDESTAYLELYESLLEY